MDRRVKERLIGASILVVLIVLVVPELLSGPRAALPPPAQLPAASLESHRVIEIVVPSAKSPAASSETNLGTTPVASAEAPVGAPGVPLSSSASSSMPAGAVPAGAVPAGAVPAGAVPAAAVPASTSARAHPPAPVESSTPSPISSTRAWAVQLGSFVSRENAEKLQRQLKTEGFQVYTSAGGTGPALRYRVRVGPLADRESAERTVARLKALKHESSIVPPAA